MNGDPNVMRALQDAINLEATLSTAYYLNGKSLRSGLGLKTGKELKDLGKQCCSYKKKLLKRLFFLDGTPEISVETVIVGDGVGTVLNDLRAMELNAVAFYTTLMTIALEAKDGNVFHIAQHLIKWHETGGNGFRGHVRYLEHELKQLTKLGENDYVAAHI